jgi:hypothetical protein
MATKDQAIQRVMKLLALAADENATEAERELAAQNAENLMAQHMIDRFNDLKDLGSQAKTKPIKDTWTVTLGRENREFNSAVRSLIIAILKHNNIRFYPRLAWGTDENGHTDYDTEVWTIVGYPEDIAYAEAIWFRVFREFVMSVNPSWNASQSLGYNLFHLTRAGLKWNEIWKIAYRNGADVPDPATNSYSANSPSMLKREVKKYMREAGLGDYTPHTQRHKAYRSSFAESFAGTISQRLRTMRAAAEKVTVGDLLPALRSTAKYVDEEFERLFGDEIRKMMAEDAAYRAKLPRRRYRIKASDNYDETAWERGNAAAQKVNLRADGEVRHRKAGELQ